MPSKFKNNRNNLNLSYKTDLNFWDCFQGGNKETV